MIGHLSITHRALCSAPNTERNKTRRSSKYSPSHFSTKDQETEVVCCPWVFDMWILQGSSDLLSVRIISEPLKALHGVRSLKYSQGEESFLKKQTTKHLLIIAIRSDRQELVSQNSYPGWWKCGQEHCPTAAVTAQSLSCGLFIHHQQPQEPSYARGHRLQLNHVRVPIALLITANYQDVSAPLQFNKHINERKLWQLLMQAYAF